MGKTSHELMKACSARHCSNFKSKVLEASLARLPALHDIRCQLRPRREERGLQANAQKHLPRESRSKQQAARSKDRLGNNASWQVSGLGDLGLGIPIKATRATASAIVMKCNDVDILCGAPLSASS